MSLPRSQNELITSPRRGCKARPIALSSTTSHTPSPSPTPTHGHGWVSVPTGLCWGCCWTSPSFSGRLGALCVKNKQRFLSRVSCTLGRKVVMGMSSPPKKKNPRWEKVSWWFPPHHHFLWVTLGSGIVCCFPMAKICEIFYSAFVVYFIIRVIQELTLGEHTVTLGLHGELLQPGGRNSLSSYQHNTLYSDFF